MILVFNFSLLTPSSAWGRVGFISSPGRTWEEDEDEGKTWEEDEDEDEGKTWEEDEDEDEGKTWKEGTCEERRSLFRWTGLGEEWSEGWTGWSEGEEGEEGLSEVKEELSGSFSFF